MEKAVEKKKMGRPTVVSDTKMYKVEEGLRMGLTVEEAAFRANIHVRTVYNYFQKDPEWKQRIDLMRRSMNIGAKEVIALKIKEKDPFTSRWFLEKTDPAFSQKIQSVNLNVNASSELTDDQKRAIAERYASRTEEGHSGA